MAGQWSFFLGFWHLIGQEVLAMIEETCKTSIVYGALNSTFIALITEKSKPKTFDDF